MKVLWIREISAHESVWKIQEAFSLLYQGILLFDSVITIIAWPHLDLHLHLHLHVHLLGTLNIHFFDSWERSFLDQ